MTARDVAGHFNAKEVKRGKLWRALCPVHGDKTPSLNIKDGKTGVMIFCQSHQCSFLDIVRAAGLKPMMLRFDYDPQGKPDRKALAEFRRKRWEDGKLERMERRQAVLMWLDAMEPCDAYKVALRGVSEGIMKHLDALEPERVRMRKFHAAVARLGWDTIWDRFLMTDKGKAALAGAEAVR